MRIRWFFSETGDFSQADFLFDTDSELPRVGERLFLHSEIRNFFEKIPSFAGRSVQKLMVREVTHSMSIGRFPFASVPTSPDREKFKTSDERLTEQLRFSEEYVERTAKGHVIKIEVGPEKAFIYSKHEAEVLLVPSVERPETGTGQ